MNTVVSGASNIKGPNGVEIIDGRVWWLDQQLGRIQSVLPDGSDLKSYDATPSYNPYDLDVSGSNLYWTHNGGGTINVIDMAAPSPASSVLMNGLNSPFAVDVADNFIYWSEVAGHDRLRRSAMDGSGAVTLVSNVQSYDFEVTSQYIYMTTTFGSVLRTNLDGTGSTTLASSLGFLNGIDVTDDLIYVSGLSGNIHSLGLLGENVSPLYSSNQIRGVAYLPAALPAAPAAVPEPSTLALVALGLIGVPGFARRRNRGV